jgi:Ca2+-transporting ATPase
MKYKDVKGLTDFEVLASRSKHGSNELPPREVESFWDKLKENFEDPIIRILMVALGITILLACFGYADWVEGFGIAIAVFLATFVSTYSEYKNEASFRELQEQASRAQNTVFRNGVLTKVFIGEIVVGDMVLLQAGDAVPADGKLVFGEIFVDQSSLSGEKDPRRKCVAQKNYLGETQDYEDEYLCFRGSVVDAGEGVMRVDIVGEKSSYGQLYRDLADAEDRESPLQRKLSDLADGVATFGYIGATLIAVSFLFKQFVVDQKYSLQNTLSYISTEWHLALHDFVHAVTLAIIVIVVAVPEGLPMMIAIVLSLNMRKLLKDNVLVRKVSEIEAGAHLLCTLV